MLLLQVHQSFSPLLSLTLRGVKISSCHRRTWSLRSQLQARGKSSHPQSKVPPWKGSVPPERADSTPEPHPQVNQPPLKSAIRANAPDQEPGQRRERLDKHGLPYAKINFLRPTIWAISVSAGIYAFLAFLEARSAENPAALHDHGRHFSPRQGAPPNPLQLASQIWAAQYPVDKVSYGLIATNGVVHLGSYIAPAVWRALWHMPARNFNITMFTSTFVHDGPFHLLINMYACYNFLPSSGRSKLFEGNPYHTLAFFLSTGVLTGLAGHLALAFKKDNFLRYVRSGGASGALFAFFGIFCTEFPHAHVGIILLPFDFEASNFLPFVMLFDFIGMVRGYKFVNWGHAAHFSGALMGIAYSYFDGKNKIWNPLVNRWRGLLR